ncbi:MAG: MFS transporter [Tepidisphaeraceae bacterium]|jgi:ACS family hexuronate transporter-like MFS transporter
MAQTDSASGLSQTVAQDRPTNFRWVICGLLFYATTVNYVDRSVLNVLGSRLRDAFRWNAVQFGHVNMAFFAAYTVGLFSMGWLIDRWGTKIVYSVAMSVWTLAAVSTSLTRTIFQFALCRFFLGLGESGNFPAAIKTVAEWFPQRQRATATGIFNSGSNVGALLAPWLVPIVVAHYGSWRAAFFITPPLAIFWIILWSILYRHPEQHPLVNRAELNFIDSDGVQSKSKVPWTEILRHRQAWAIMAGKFLTDPVWWFYNTWMGLFLKDVFGVDLKHVGPPLILIYLMADLGSIGGGWFSSSLLKKGWSANAARKTAMFTCAMAVLPVCLAPKVGHEWIAVGLIGLATAAHQGFSANIFTLASDMFPKRAVGSVTGLAACCGGIGGIIIQEIAGTTTQATGSYVIIFCIAGTVYLLAVVLLHILAPRLTPVQLSVD